MNNSKGILVTFEGQDASGKTTLLKLTTNRLRSQGIATILIPEFSSNLIGSFIKEVLKKDKFLRLNRDCPSALTETMYLLSDLYSQDEWEIRNSINQDNVVIKERHIDSILACQIPKIVTDYPDCKIDDLFRWLEGAMSHLCKPDLTFFLKTSRKVMKQRISNRGESCSESDLLILDKRQEIYDRIASRNLKRWIVIDNDETPEDAVRHIIDQIKKCYLTVDSFS